MKDYRVTRIPNFLEFIRVACPVCGHTGGCMIHTDGDRVVCIRIESKIPFSKNSSLPSWLHFLNGNKRHPGINDNNIEQNRGNKKLADSELNKVYSIMLDYLELTDEHYNHLTSPSRGLTDEEVMTRGYTSFPAAPWTLAKAIQNDYGIESFAGVPGFFEATGKYGDYWSVLGREGILIPYRNNRNEITGFQYRIDNPPPVAKIKQLTGVYGLKATNNGNQVKVFYEKELIFEKEMQLNETVSLEDSKGKTLGFVSLKKGNRYYWLSSANKKNGTGAGSPSPVHVAVPSRTLKNWQSGQSLYRKKIWLTEGALKADIAVDMLQRSFTQEQLAKHGDTFAAIPGVNAWQTVIPIFEDMGVEEINLAFDRDFTSNEYVMSSLKEFLVTTKQKGYHVNMVSWGKDDGKGIDDLLLTGSKIPKITRIF
ncbi:DUF3854 domain-containing protein [Oceanobacillus luteolus]|uniref:DUF3854 domain-containing protein n=1 Tax=Oceanobacillus luteolus TaxID=1274358 RepID=A0ABW4HWR3_9BACI